MSNSRLLGKFLQDARNSTSEAESADSNTSTTERKRGRPKGRRSNPDYTQISALVPWELHQEIKLALLQKSIKEKNSTDLSALIEDLLSDWLAEWKADNNK